MAEGFEPSHGRINSAVPYQLGYATKSESGCGDETRTRTPSFTRRALCYPIELRRNLVDWEGFKPSQEVCRTSMLSVTSPAPRIYHLPLDIFHLPFIRLRPALSESDDLGQGLKMTK